jgi:tetratricopeptide (TPR) repeat protein
LLLLEEATWLARQGQYADAEALVRQALCLHTKLDGRLWDLLAKVYAQQGRFLDAETCWRKALEESPNDPGYHAGIRAICQQQRASGVMDAFFVCLIAITFAAFVGFALYDFLEGNAKSVSVSPKSHDFGYDVSHHCS